MKNLVVPSQLFLLIVLVLCQFEKVYSFSNDQNSKSTTFVYLEPQNIRTFIDEINRLGKLGYRLKATERYGLFLPPEKYKEIKIAGLAELNPGNTYEYTWFNTLTLPEFGEKMEAPAKEGFYFSHLVHYSLTVPEDYSSNDGSLESSMATISRGFSQDPEDGSIFILERKNDFRDPTEFVTASPTSTKKSIFGTNVINKKEITETLEQAVADIDTRTYQPVAAFYSSVKFTTRLSHLNTILFQNTWEYNDGGVRPNYKIVKAAGYDGSFYRLMSIASKQEFEIAALGRLCAVMLETGRRVEYYWLHSSEKNFDQYLTNISEAGARFKMNGVDGFMKNVLVFEQTSGRHGKINIYKTLKVTDKPRRVKGLDEPQITTSPESLKEFDELQRQGYRVRSLFYRNGINILFEKPILER